MEDVLESDRLLEFPHPRETSAFVGNAAAEQKLLRSFLSGKMHHAWIIAGPRGIGKATLAYRFARFVLRHADPAAIAASADGLAVDPDDPVFRRIAAGAHPDLFVARRAYDPKTKRLKRDVSADTVRQVSHFFGHTSGAGGWRVCIVDAADDMNRSAANALLKVLEEPPARCLFLLVTHNPLRLVPTVRSRCIRITLQPLLEREFKALVDRHMQGRTSVSDADFPELTTLCQGSPGQALAVLSGDAWKTFGRFRDLIQSTRKPAGPAMLDFAETLGARGAEEGYSTFCRLMLDWLASRVRKAAERSPADRRDAEAMAGAWQHIAHSIDRANALNLDRKQTILQTLQLIEDTGAQSILRG